MTITKHTPVTPGGEAQRALDRLIKSGTVDLILPKPPRFMFDWLDLVDYQDGDTQHRRKLATDALERERLHRWGMKAPGAPATAQEPAAPPRAPAQAPETAPQPPEQQQEQERPNGTPERIPTPYKRARPGTPYVPCAAECGALLRSPRTSVAYCHGCAPKRARRAPEPDDFPWKGTNR